MRSVNREIPFEAEESLNASVRIRRDDRDEQPAFFNLTADRSGPLVSTPQFAPVEPDLHPGTSKARCDSLGGRGVFRRMAYKYCPDGLGQPVRRRVSHWRPPTIRARRDRLERVGSAPETCLAERVREASTPACS